jgi:transposase
LLSDQRLSRLLHDTLRALLISPSLDNIARIWDARTGKPLGNRLRHQGPVTRAALIAFYDMLMRHIDGVVAWARHRLTNAALEGNNNRVRAISQRARAHGYRNPTT